MLTTKKKIVGISLLILLGGVLFFSPVIYKIFVKPKQDQIMLQIKDRFPQASPTPQSLSETLRERSAPILKSAPAPVKPKTSVDDIFGYIQKGIGVGSSLLGLFAGIKTFLTHKKERRKRRATT